MRTAPAHSGPAAESGLWRWKPGPPRRYATPGMELGDLSKADDGRLLIAMSGAGLMQIAGDKLEPYPVRSASHPKACSRTAMSIRINCSGTAMEVSGSEPTSGGSSMCTTGGQMYLRNRMASQETLSSAFSRIVKAISGSPPLEDSTGFESLLSLLISVKQGLSSDRYSLGDRSHRWKRLGRRSSRV